jgi:hypothetical protein
MDMRYQWLTDRVRQKQFDVYWRLGCENLGDYHTKHHSVQPQCARTCLCCRKTEPNYY